MSLELTIRNRQQTRGVETRWLRRITTALLTDLIAVESVELGITLVAAPEMTRLNGRFLQHEGSTDVITFDHTENQTSRRKSSLHPQIISAELYICVDDAAIQARSFGTTWQAELVRYIIHGVLHLCGHDDHEAGARRVMKREENRLLRLLEARFGFHELTKSRRPK